MVRLSGSGKSFTGNDAMAGKGDLNAHEQTYFQVIGLLKWGAVACAAIAAAVIYLISR